MALRRPDRCAVCSRELAAGTVADWNRERREVTCVECPPAVAEGVAGEGVAGASALREYERRRARREARAREKLGRFGAFAAKLTGEPSSTTAWKRGAAGEALTARRLSKHLDDSGVRLLHDRLRPGHGAANIDHLAVGPGGVTVIDSKAYRGAVRVSREGGLFVGQRSVLRVNGRDQTKLIASLRRQIADVETALTRAGFPGLDTRGALCFTEADGLPIFRSLAVDGVMIDGPRAVAKLANRPGSLTASTVQAMWEALGRAFPGA